MSIVFMKMHYWSFYILCNFRT